MAGTSSAGGKRSRRKERTRRAILEAAAGCFGAAGFDACSMEAIGEAAGVTKPTLYAYFASKEQLFDTLLRETFARLKDDALPEVDSVEGVAAALLAHAKGHMKMLLDEPILGLIRATAAEVMRRPEWAKELMEELADPGLERWLADLDRRGLLRVRSPKAAAEIFWSLVKGQLFFPAILGLRPPAAARERARVLKEAVRVFVDAHAPAGDVKGAR
jgi:AcrR family transcriptional regulator